jgi:hypothetical protein
MIFEVALIIANILSFLGNTTFTLSSIFKKKNWILLLQSIAHILSSIAEIINKAYSGLVQEIASLLRDLVLVFVNKDNKLLKIIITLIFVVIGSIIGTVLNFKLNQNNWYDYLPILATISYTIFLIISEYSKKYQEVFIKVGLIFNSIGWIIYTLFYKLYPPTIFNSITIISSLVTIVLFFKKKPDNKDNEDENNSHESRDNE